MINLKHIHWINLCAISLIYLLACSPGTSKGNSLGEVIFRFLFRNEMGKQLGLVSGSQITSLPSKITVSIPRSIRKSDTTLSSILERKYQRQTTTSTSTGTSTFTSTTTAEAKGYQNLTEIVEKMFALLGQSRLELLLLDKTIADAKAAPGTCIEGGSREITITQEMEDEILKSMQEYGLSEAKANALLASKQESGVLPEVGQKVPSPPIKYIPIPKDATDTTQKKDYELGYRQMIHYTTGSRVLDKVSCPSKGSGYTKTLKFDDEFKKIFYQVKATLDVPGIAIEILSNITMTKGDSTAKTTDTMVFNMTTKESKGSRISTTIDKNTVKQCKTESENKDTCIRISSTTTMKDAKSSNEFDMKVEVDGKITDNGGFIRTEHKDALFGDKMSNGGVRSYYIKELFDGSGGLKGLEASKDGKTYMPAPGFQKIDLTSDMVTGMFGGEQFDGFGMGSNSAQVFLGFKTSPQGIGGDGFMQEDKFIIYNTLTDADQPNGFDDPFIVGEGMYQNPCFSATTSSSCAAIATKGCVWDSTNSKCKNSKIIGDNIFIEYWGTKDVIPRLTLWKRSVSVKGEAAYTKITGTNTFEALDKNPYVSTTSQFYDPFTDPNFDPRNSCYANPASCVSAGGTFNMGGGVDCAKNSTDVRCAYDPSKDTCYGKAETECNSTSGCTYDSYNSTCANTFGQCYPHLNSTSCTTSTCSWDSSFKMCQPAGGVDCSANKTMETCFAFPNCMWDPTSTSCMKNTMGFGIDPNAISACLGATQANCESNYLCQWSSANSRCDVGCGAHYEQTVCQGSPVGCAWSATSYNCYYTGTPSSTASTGCSGNKTPSTCTSMSGCIWDTTMYVCLQSASGCSANVTQPTCSTAPGCSWDFSTFICKVDMCEGQPQTMCGTMPGCSWDSATFACKNAGSGFVATGCAANIDMNSCGSNSACLWDTTTLTCKDNTTPTTGCASYITSPTCITDPTCNWDASQVKCVNKPASSCSTYTNTSACTGDAACNWDTPNNICMNKPSCAGQTQAICSTIQGCMWDTNANAGAGDCVLSNPPPQCSTNTDAATCTSNAMACFWDANASCQPCGGLTSPSLCTTTGAASCKWNSTTNTCIKGP